MQLTNDLDVHVALLHAPSYQKQMVSQEEFVRLATYDTLTLCVWQDEKYYDQHKTVAKTVREYVDLFGIMQKVPNAVSQQMFVRV